MASAYFDRRAGFWPRALLLMAAFFCAPLPVHAWIEQTVAGHETTITLERNGWIEARHQLTLSLRGGPLKVFEIEGIGSELEFLGDAKVTRVKSTSVGVPLRLTQAEGGALRLEVLGSDGLRGGTYRFEFAYRLDAAQRKLLEPDGERVILSWVGPRLPGGVDSGKLLVSVPHAAKPPSLPKSLKRAARGVLLGQLLVGSTKDEIELLRAHIAVGEPAVWQIEFDRSVLSGPLPDDPRAPQALTRSAALLPRHTVPLSQLGVGLAALISVVLLILGKERAVRILSERSDARTRPLVPAPAWLRAVGAGSAVVGFVACAFMHRALLGMACGVVLALFIVHFPPVRRNSPRGPGSWAPISVSECGARRWPLLVRAFDPGTLPGFSLAAWFVCLGTGLAYSRLPHDGFQALMCLSFVLLLSPLFLTGRSTDFPRLPAEQALPWYRFLAGARVPLVRGVELWGRRTERESLTGAIDEVRLRMTLEEPPAGLRALEVAFEEGPGAYVAPCLVLRVVEDSPSHERLAEGIVWSRGRQSEEKIAILHPAAPTRAQLLRLLKSVLAHLAQGRTRQRTTAGPQTASPAHAASGRGIPTAKVASPLA